MMNILHDVLDRYGIRNSFDVYSGTHTSKVADRFQKPVLLFSARIHASNRAAGNNGFGC
jgi:hypothetical protein